MSADKMHFIVIDDSRLDCFIAEKVIENSGRSASVRSFQMASQALDYIKTLSPSPQKTILFIDIQMPAMDGFDFIEAFEQQVSETVRNNFILHLLSSSINESDLTRAQAFKSVHSFLNKPLTKNILSTALARLSE